MPYLSSAAAGLLGLAVANVLGVGEVVMAGAVAYATFRLLKDGVTLRHAAREALMVCEGGVPR